jgi:hypothetical protein
MKVWAVSMYLTLAGTAFGNVSCPPLNRDGLAQILAKRPVRKLIFFASWCGECRSHLLTSDPSADILIAAFDEQSTAEQVVSRLKIKTPCYSDQGLTAHFHVRSVPFEIHTPKI